MTQEVKPQPGKFMLKDVRLSFPNLFEAKQVQGQGDEKFSAAFILPKNHPQLGEIKAAIAEVAKGKWGEAAEKTKDAAGADITLPKYQVVLKSLAATDKLCLHDGDSKSEREGYAGNLFINASNTIRPLTLGAGPEGRAPVTASDGKLYAGCYVNVSVQFWSQDNKFGKRVNASLLGVQFVKDGERLAGGSTAAADDFEAIPTTGAAAVATTGQGAGALF